MAINSDFRDLYAALNDVGARYLLEAAYGDQPIHVISRDHLRKNKLAMARPQDLLDADVLK